MKLASWRLLLASLAAASGFQFAPIARHTVPASVTPPRVTLAMVDSWYDRGLRLTNPPPPSPPPPPPPPPAPAPMPESPLNESPLANLPGPAIVLIGSAILGFMPFLKDGIITGGSSSGFTG